MELGLGEGPEGEERHIIFKEQRENYNRVSSGTTQTENNGAASLKY